MKYIGFYTFTLMICLFTTACSADQGGKNQVSANSINTQKYNNLDSAYFASGCFWCVEAIYETVKGVKEAVSGFAGGSKKNPSYQEVAYGRTNHAETVKVYYNPEQVDFKTLVKVYYGSQNPTTKGQDPDFGEQYRSIIFYTNKREKKIAKNFKERVASSGKYNDPIVTKIKSLEAFWQASEKHQDYESKNPNAGYIQQVSKPRLNAFKEKYPGLIKDNH